MKKIVLFVAVLTVLILALVGCDLIGGILNNNTEHEHAGGAPTCLKGAVCTECGEEYGEPTKHSYSSPTCQSGSTCEACGDVLDDKLEHTLGEFLSDEEGHWRECAECKAQSDRGRHTGGESTCTEGKVCSVCDKQYTDPDGHVWDAATCTVPKTCRYCGATEGEAGHSYSDEYSRNDDKHWIECGVCGDKINEAEHTGGEATVNDKAKCDICGASYGDYLEVSIDWKIEATLPVSGATVRLANERISGWYAGYDYRSTDTNSYMTGEDIFTPDVPVIKWTVGDTAKYYKVYVANRQDLSDKQCYLTNLTELSLEHLFVNTTYYWYVDAVYGEYTVRSEVFTFKTLPTPRTVNIEGVSNSRDIGGYVTVDGKMIRQGMIYRSAKLDDITEVGKYTLVNILGVKTDLDLRGDREKDAEGKPYVGYKNATHPVAELEHVTVACPWYSTGENGIWYDEFNKNEFAKAIKVFADIDNYPIVFHCSLGRDRTGTLAMVLGGLLGLDENTLMMEYELSAFSYWGAYGANFNTGLRNNIHGTYEYIDNNYDGESFSEKVADFLLDIGVTEDEIASIKSIMLKEAE